ncbi:hypothetical protein ABZV31_04460 [Streptomyces sp. NPDC005202]|uniref:hypothetical protein n=1 Tax=Streptomyces sp. NPDC005202 TaxID=3157021 RepID=UPI0033A0B5AE
MGASGQHDDRAATDEEDVRPDNWHVPADRNVYTDEGLPGQPLTVLLFVCTEHGEEKTVDYYDPADPPRCNQGDLMVRMPR